MEHWNLNINLSELMRNAFELIGNHLTLSEMLKTLKFNWKRNKLKRTDL